MRQGGAIIGLVFLTAGCFAPGTRAPRPMARQDFADRPITKSTHHVEPDVLPPPLPLAEIKDATTVPPSTQTLPPPQVAPVAPPPVPVKLAAATTSEPSANAEVIPAAVGPAAPPPMVLPDAIPPAPDSVDPVVAALQLLLEQRPGDAVVPLEQYDRDTQELLLRLLPVVAGLSRSPEKNPRDLTRMTEQLEGVIHRLRPRAELLIENMCFCRRIYKFGRYEPLALDYRFRSGELVQLYVELRNFSSRHQGQFYETRLASSVEIRDGQQRIIWRQDFKDRDRPDRSRTPRMDYFNGYRFCIPDNIPPGTYQLVLRVADVNLPDRPPAERSLDVRITTRPRDLR